MNDLLCRNKTRLQKIQDLRHQSIHDLVQSLDLFAALGATVITLLSYLLEQFLKILHRVVQLLADFPFLFPPIGKEMRSSDQAFDLARNLLGFALDGFELATHLFQVS